VSESELNQKMTLLVESLGAARRMRGRWPARQRGRADSQRAVPHGQPGERAATAALAMGALVWVAGLSPGSPQPPACPHPQELHASQGWSTAVLCGPSTPARNPLRGPAKLLFGEAIDLNRADPHSLEALPAIGPKRAAAIVSTRAQRPFRNLDDLERVPGIGPGIASNLRAWVKASDPADASKDH
jgi:hypothetical protein